MKKINKMALSFLSITSFAILVPTILTSCSNQVNDTNNPDVKPPVDNKETKIVPKLQSHFELVGSVSDLFNSNKELTNIGDLFTSKINNSEELKWQLISNYYEFSDAQKEKLNIKITTSDSSTGNTKWGGTTDFKTWSTNAQVVNYNINLPAFDITNGYDLKTQLSDATKLKEIMKNSGRTNANNAATTYTLVDSSQIQIDNYKDYFNINVSETLNNTTTQLNLKLPVSDINLIASNAKVSVSHSDSNLVETKEAAISLSYNVGIDNTVVLPSSFNKTLTLDTTEITVASVINKLGFNAITVRTTASNSDVPILLNNEKIAETTQIFNVQFGNPRLSNDNKKLMFDIAPTDNHYFNDGSNNTKVVSIDGLTITSKPVPNDAIFASNFTVADTYNLNNYTASLDNFKAWVASGTVRTTLINTVKTKIASATTTFKFVELTYAGDEKMTWDEQTKKPSMVFTVTP